MKRKRRKRVSKSVPAKGRLLDFADALWSLAVRDDWANRCAVCGCRNVEAHHLLPRQWYSRRYVVRNGIALCARCHKFDPEISPHLNAGGWVMWLEGTWPLVNAWYQQELLDGEYKQFTQTRNWVYYADIIKELRQLVPEDQFARLCKRDGFVKFVSWLDTEYEQ